MVLEVAVLLSCIKELILYFQKLFSGELHIFYSGEFPRPGIESGALESDTQSPGATAGYWAPYFKVIPGLGNLPE